MDLSMVQDNDQIQLENVELAIGVRVPRSVRAPIDFLAEAKEYDSTADLSIKRQMELCEKLYRYEGTVGTAIDVMTEFAVTDTRAEDTGDKELDKIIAYFNDNVNAASPNTLPGVYTLLQQICLEFFIKGNVFPYATWSHVDIDGISAPVALPTSITLLNPNNIDIPEESFAFGQEIINYNPGDKVMQLLQKDGRKNRNLTSLRKGISPNTLRSVKNVGFFGTGFELDPRYITHLKRKARDYMIWGVPYLTRTFAAIAIIKKLRKLDEATTEGLINLVTIFKVGTEEHPANGPRIKAFAQLLNDPAASTTLVWAHDIDVSQHGPDGKILAFKDKYKEAYDELLRALGIPLGMYGASGSVTWEDFLGLAERLKAWRDITKAWLNKIYKQIAVENGKKNIAPKARMARMNLTDETAIKTLIMNFWDRGLLDPETALTDAGYNFDSVVSKKEEFAKMMQTLFVPPALPFSQTNGQPPTDNKAGSKPNAPIKKKLNVENTVNLKTPKRVK